MWYEDKICLHENDQINKWMIWIEIEGGNENTLYIDIKIMTVVQMLECMTLYMNSLCEWSLI